MLATSRAPLHLYGEQQYPLSPLALPQLQNLPPAERLARVAAVALLLERAQAVRPDFTLSPGERRRARGDLRPPGRAAPRARARRRRLKVLPPAALLARLGTRLEVLTDGPADWPSRHRSLRGAVAWSYDLLEPGEQALFRRLAVFAGGCSLGAAEAVCGLGAHGRGVVLHGLASLVDKSLVQQAAGADDEPRFALLETMREYGREQVEECGELPAVRRRHAEYFLAVAEDAEWKIWSAETPRYLALLEREHDNFRAALAWSLEAGAAEIGLRLAGALAWFWFIRGYFSEGRRWLEQLLAAGGSGDSLGRAKALNGLGNLANRQGEYDLAAARLEESLAICRRLGSRVDTAFALNNLGMVAYQRGEYDRAEALLEEALGLYGDLVEQPHLARTLGNLGIVARARGDAERAAGLHERALTLARAVGHREVIGWALNILGGIARDRGEHDRAAVLLEESIDVYRAMGHKWRAAMALRTLADVEQLRGNPARSAALYRECLGLYQDLGLGDKSGVALCLAGLAGAAAMEGLRARAARLGGAAAALREAGNAPLDPTDQGGFERQLRAARPGLADEKLASAWAEGGATPLERVVDDALSLAERAGRPHPRRSDLTRREREVAALVARGLTDRQIAVELVVSGRTVVHHLEHIREKLGFRSRAQIAAWAVEHGLHPIGRD